MTPTVVIIGAGPAGLAATAALHRRNIHPIVLEQGPAVATSWRGRHQELRLNTIRWLSDLPGLRIPRQAGRWVTRDDYIAYLEGFAERQHLNIHFGVQARHLDPTPDGWRVTTTTGIHDADHVIVATGHDRLAQQPDWPGRSGFHPLVQHVADLPRAADLTGKRVLLVGAGNSAVEIAGHLVDASVAELWMSVRTPPNILPRQLHGIPMHPLALLLRRLPERLRDILAQTAARYAFGDLGRHGLPTPDQGPYRRMRTTGVTVAVDQGFVAHLTAGRLRIVTTIDHLDGTDVVLRDGSRLQPDVILTATGYRPGLTDLVGHLDVLDQRGLPRTPNPAHPAAAGLWFIGYHPAIGGNLRQHPIEARRIARAIAATTHRHAQPVAAAVFGTVGQHRAVRGHRRGDPQWSAGPPRPGPAAAPAPPG